VPFLAAAAPYIALASTAVSAYSQTQAGDTAKNQGLLAQMQAERNANAEEAMSQQAAAADRKKARYLRSRAIAVAGASGAGVSDPTVSDILTGIDTEGEMNALTALYEGRIRADNTRKTGQIYANEGSARKKAAYGQAASTALSGFTDFASSGAGDSFFKKYGSTQVTGSGAGTGSGFQAAAGNFARVPNNDDWTF
jgi:hypothetical protein